MSSDDRAGASGVATREPAGAGPVPDRALYLGSLRASLAGLFRPSEEGGFWSSSDRRLLPRLDYRMEDGRPRWTPNPFDLHRYAPVALMGATCWRTSPYGDATYDDELRANLEHYRELVSLPARRDTVPSYGAGALIYAFARGHEVWPDDGFDETAEALSESAFARYRFRFNEDSLVLMGTAARGPRLSGDHRKLLALRAASIRAAQNSVGLYLWPEESGCFRHQNQMYAIWGLAHADLALGVRDSAESIRRCLDLTVRDRMQEDGALLWHHYRGPLHRMYAFARGRLDRTYMPEHRCLFSCHQVFFVYAALLYRRLTGDDRYDEPMDRAMRWLYGGNAARRNMFELTGTGLPWRIMTTEGQLQVPRHHFLKAYEIGAMILALVGMLERDAA